jgi:hypothetical protein
MCFSLSRFGQIAHTCLRQLRVRTSVFSRRGSEECRCRNGPSKMSSGASHQTVASRSNVLQVWLRAVIYWYLTGLLAALGFSFGYCFVRSAPGSHNERSEFLDAFTSMDGESYKEIATEGYHYEPNARSNVAFFPVYPLFGRAIIAVTGLRAEAALLVVSHLSFLVALAILAFYVRIRYPDAPRNLADLVVITAALFPTGCFFRLTYSESTFIALALLAMYAMRRHWPYWTIAFTIGLATAARPVGVALIAPFAIHICRREPHRWEAEGRRAATKGASARAIWDRDHQFVTDAPPTCSGRDARGVFHERVALLGRLATYLPLACWGLLAFTAYQYYVFGDPFAICRAQFNWRIRPEVSWSEKLTALITLEPIRSVYTHPSPAFWASQDLHGIPWFSLQFANPLYFLMAAGLIAFGACPGRQWAIRQLDRSGAGKLTNWLSLEELSLGGLMLFIPYVTRGYEMGMGSAGRFVSVVFPIYLVLGQMLIRFPHSLRVSLAMLPSFLLAINTALYAAGYPIF